MATNGSLNSWLYIYIYIAPNALLYIHIHSATRSVIGGWGVCEEKSKEKQKTIKKVKLAGQDRGAAVAVAAVAGLARSHLPG